LNKGRFITFEGGEGAGKTTLILAIGKELQARGYTVLVTREPGGIPIAEKIREVILDRNHDSMDGHTEALLYAAARRQHLVEKVIPALSRNEIVLCDRFIDSSLAYQGVARGLGMEQIWTINQFAIQNYMPELTIYMDIPPEIGLARIANAEAREINRLDLEKQSFHDKVREGYLSLCEQYPTRIHTVDATCSEKEVFEQAIQLILPLVEGI